MKPSGFVQELASHIIKLDGGINKREIVAYLRNKQGKGILFLLKQGR